MAEEVLYASVGGEANKRKYDDSPSPAARRASGFSSPPDSAAPPPAYNNVPPPMSEIELAKQKAQEIAARLLNTSDPSKRARAENGGGGGFDSSDYGSQRPMGFGLGGPPQVASSGYPGPNKKIEIPNGRVGVIIGKGGETIKYLQLQSGAKIQVTRDMDADPNSATRGVEITGTPDQIAKAEQLISDVLSEAETGGSGVVSRRLTGQPSGEQFVMKIPNNKVGLVIGKGGETIKNMQARTGARVQVIPLHLPPGDMSQERTVQIDGTSEQIEAAKQLVDEVTSENRMRNPSMSGGYPQQQGYQARPPSNWQQPAPPMQQQSGYGYGQYNMNQPSNPYSGYPPQPTWDQSASAQQNQPAASQAATYDYYSQQQQQQQQTAPTDGSSTYGAYSQGQSYSQDGYGGYYNSSAYGNVSNPTSDGQTPSYGTTQGEANQAPPPGQSYPPEGSTQPGYGSYAPPQAQKPQNGQPGYAQAPAGGPGYAQAGYGAPAYGAPPATYGQQYNSSYGAPPAYSSDGTTPPPQTGGAAKASPPS